MLQGLRVIELASEAAAWPARCWPISAPTWSWSSRPGPRHPHLRAVRRRTRRRPRVIAVVVVLQHLEALGGHRSRIGSRRQAFARSGGHRRRRARGRTARVGWRLSIWTTPGCGPRPPASSGCRSPRSVGGVSTADVPVTDLTILAGGGPVWNCGYDDHSASRPSGAAATRPFTWPASSRSWAPSPRSWPETSRASASTST